MECAWAKYHANRTVLTNKNISVKLRLRLFDSVVSPTATYGLATCALTQQQRTKIAAARAAMLRKIVGFWKRPDEDWEDAGRRCKHRLQNALSQHPVSDWLQVVDRLQWRLVHKTCQDDLSWPKTVMKWLPLSGKRPRGRPRTRWTDNVNKYLSSKHATSLSEVLHGTQVLYVANFEDDFVDFMTSQ